MRLAIADWEKGASQVNDCEAVGGSVSEKDCPGWAGKKGNRRDRVLHSLAIALGYRRSISSVPSILSLTAYLVTKVVPPHSQFP
jgi:hypothetical protein